MGAVPVVTEDASPDYVTDVLRDAGVIGEATSVVDVGHERIGEGVGLMCTLARLTLGYDGPADEAPSSVILKVPSNLPENRAVGDHFGFYEREGRFYQDVAESLVVCTPRCFGNHIDVDRNEFALLLEDFGGRTMVSQVDGMDVDRATQALEALALVHAQWWNAPALHRLSWMPRAIDPGIISAGESYRQAWPRFVDIFGDLLPDGAVELGERIGPSWEATQTALFERTPTTLCHGDFRSDNLMFDDAASATDRVGVLDWQISYRSGGIGDVCYLATQSMTVEQRRAHERECLAAWHERVCSALGHRPDYTVEQAWDDYRACTGNMTVYGVVSGGSLDPANERGLQLVTEMVTRSFTAALDLDAAGLIPT